MAVSSGSLRILRIRQGKSRVRDLASPSNRCHTQETRPASRYGGIITAFDARLGLGRIACEEAGGNVLVSAAEFVGFEVGDIVSFQLAADDQICAQVATVLEAEDEQALQKLRCAVRREALENKVVDAVQCNDEETLRTSMIAARDVPGFDADTLWLGEAKLRMLCATRELRATQELVSALELTGTVAMEDELRLKRALHEVKAACAEVDAAADSVSFRNASSVADAGSDSEDGEVEVVETDPYMPVQDDTTRLQQLEEELESIRAEKRKAAVAEDYTRAAKLRRREVELECERRQECEAASQEVQVVEVTSRSPER